MSILGMARARVRREVWQEIRRNGERRKAIREACQAVVDATSSESEFAAITRLRGLLP